MFWLFSVRREVGLIYATHDRVDHRDSRNANRGTTSNANDPAGDAITASNIRFVRERFEAQGSTWAELEDIDPDETIQAGDRVTLTADATFQIDVIWTGDDGTKAVLDRQDGPDA